MTLFYLSLFFLISQLGLHFWPPSSFIFGIRVDYLSPAIYFSEILIFLFILQTLKKNFKEFMKLMGKKKFLFLMLILIIGTNIFFSISPFISLIKGIKFLLAILFGISAYLVRKRINWEMFVNVFSLSIILISLIGISQSLKGGTLGGTFYFLGERSFDISTPGIALQQIFGQDILRAYSVFSHPNSLAGFIGLYLVFGFSAVFFQRKKYSKAILFPALAFGSICLLFTFSASVFIALAVVGLIMLIAKGSSLNLNPKRSFWMILILFAAASFAGGFVGQPDNKIGFSDSMSERTILSQKTIEVIKGKLIFGTGLNTNVIALSETSAKTGEGVWLLQPVHNISLLLFSETGFIGFSVLMFLLSKLVSRRNIIVIVFVFVSGLLDHYWITLPQNYFLLSLLVGLLL